MFGVGEDWYLCQSCVWCGGKGFQDALECGGESVDGGGGEQFGGVGEVSDYAVGGVGEVEIEIGLGRVQPRGCARRKY